MIGIGRRLLLCGAGALLSGCGFRPVYGPRGGTSAAAQEQLAAIRILRLPERSGQLLQEELQARFDHGEALPKRYELVVVFGVSSEAIGIQRDTTFNRLRMVGSASWTLRNSSSQAVLSAGQARSVDGVNVINEQYFELDLASETATRRIATNVADQMTLQLAAFFASHPAV